MPTKPLKPCSYPGCPNLVSSGRCAQHPEDHSIYRTKETEALYNSRRWRRLRRIQLTNAPWCAACLEQDIYTPATEADHVTPHRGDKQMFFSGTLQSLCKPCHSRKTATEVFHGSKVRNGI